MKLAENRRRPRFKSRDVLDLGERQPTLAEALDFIQAGDTERLERTAVINAELNERFSAQASLHLVFGDIGLSKATLDSRKKLIASERWPYEKSLNEELSGRLPADVSITDLLNEAHRIFPFSDQLKQPLAKPSDALWEKMVSWAELSAHGNPSIQYSLLLAADPERFSELNLSEVRVKCLQAIDQQRMKRPVTKDASQVDLLRMLARTRLVFPDLFGPNSLRPEEKRAIRSHLQRSREGVAWGTGSSSFPDRFYHLALLEAPHMTVDSQGIHLSVQSGPIQPLVGLPERAEV